MIDRTTDPRLRRALYLRDKGLCGFCGQPVPIARFAIDHVQPRRHGGADAESNYRLAHLECNASAGARLPRRTRENATPRWSDEDSWIMGREEPLAPDITVVGHYLPEDGPEAVDALLLILGSIKR